MIPVSDPGAQNARLAGEIDEAIARVVRRGVYILGPEVEALEAEFAAYIGTGQAVGVANGTDAIALALRALDIGPGDEVVAPTMTAVATIAAIEMTGATPVLTDVSLADGTMDPSSLRSSLTDRTRAVIPVHLYGQAADLPAIMDICAEHDVPVIEDCSQAHGARMSGTRVGSIGLMGTFSCYPTKNLGAIGDAGLITTNDTALADRLRALRQYGWQERNWSLEPGVNSRLDELQAAILRVKLAHLDAGNHARLTIAHAYSGALADTGLELPRTRPGNTHVWHLYCVMSQQRDLVRRQLAEHGVGTAIHYPHAVHTQPAYRRLQQRVSLDIAEQVARTTLSLPMYPELERAQVERVIETVRQVVGARP